MNVLGEYRTGTWSALNSFGNYLDTDLKSNNFATFWISHGSKPTNDTYSYVILPGKSASSTTEYAKNPSIEIVENSESAHAVKETELNILGVNFWNDSSYEVAGIESNKKASVMLKEEEDQCEISVSDPTQNDTIIELEIDTPVKSIISIDDNITVLQFVPTLKLSVNTTGTMGSSLHITFETLDLDPNYTPPLAPIGLEIVNVDSDSVELKWTDNPDNDREIEKYIINYDGGTKTVEGNSVVIDGLSAETAYTFEVLAIDTLGGASPVTSTNTIYIKTLPIGEKVYDFETSQGQTVGEMPTYSVFTPLGPSGSSFVETATKYLKVAQDSLGEQGQVLALKGDGTSSAANADFVFSTQTKLSTFKFKLMMPENANQSSWLEIISSNGYPNVTLYFRECLQISHKVI